MSTEWQIEAKIHFQVQISSILLESVELYICT